MFVFLNGKFVKEEEAMINVRDHGFLYGDGVYETLRTYNGKIWQLHEHLNRLQKSAKMIKIKMPWSERQIVGWLQKLLLMNGLRAEYRIRITVTRGMNGFVFLTSKNPTLLIQINEFKPEPKWVYEEGVEICTFKGERVLPEAKSISLLPFVLARQYMAKNKSYEAVFVDDNDFVLEGTVTNLFMFKDGILYTPRRKILAGTTRDFILKIAKKLTKEKMIVAGKNFKIKVKDFKKSKLYKADEIFITNAPRGIVPVIKVDGKKIGNGRLGLMTKVIAENFNSATFG